MKTVALILPVHEIQTQNSCIAWTLEFILKLHEKIPETDYTRQLSGVSYGFGPTERAELKGLGIDSAEDSYEFADFERISKDDASIGYPLVFSLPSALNINLSAGIFEGYITHGCVAVHLDTQRDYLLRMFNSPSLFKASPQLVYQLVRAQSEPDYKIHCLRHRPLGVAF